MINSDFDNHHFILLFNIFLVLINFREISLDLLKKRISIIIFAPVFLQISLFYILPFLYINACFFADYCISPYPDLEKIIFYKGSILFSSFFAGLFLSIKLYKSNKFNFFKKILNNLPNRRLLIPNSLSLGIYTTYTLFSLAFITWGLLAGTQYYNSIFQRIFSLYITFLIPPTLLFEISKNRRKDLKLLSISLFLYSLVLFFGLGRASNFIYIFLFASCVLLTSIYPGYGILEIFKSIIKKKIFPIIILFNTSTIFFILKLKYDELVFSLSDYPLFIQNIYTGNLFSCLFDESCRKLLYGGLGSLTGIPELTIAHMINSIYSAPVNVMNHQIIELLTIPIFGKMIWPKEIFDWYAQLPSYLLNLEITDFGGFTFGSDIGFYSYSNMFIAITLIFLFGGVNIFIIYFLGTKIFQFCSKYYANQTDNQISIRPYVFFLMSTSSTATVQSGLIHAIITYIPFWLISKTFIKSR